VCEFSQSDAGGRGGCGMVEVEPTVAHYELGVGSVGGHSVHSGNGVIDPVDRGLCGWSAIIGGEGGQPTK